MNEKPEMDNSIDITNYFYGGHRKREEKLAQPECAQCLISKCGTVCSIIKPDATDWVGIMNNEGSSSS